MKRIKAGSGYYDTTSYPVGGCFKRAGENGVLIVKVLRQFPFCYGCNEEGETETGARVAYSTLYCETENANTETEGETMNTTSDTTSDTTTDTPANDTQGSAIDSGATTDTEAPATDADAAESTQDTKAGAPIMGAPVSDAPAVLVIDQMHKTDAFFANLKTLCGMVSKDETRHIITRVLVEACEIAGTRYDAEQKISVPTATPGFRFVATDGRRLATLETERAFTPGIYEIKQAKGKTIVLAEDKYAGVYPNWQQVVPSTAGMFETSASAPERILYVASRLGVILNHEYVMCLHKADYTVYIGDTRAPILVKNDDGFTMVLMPLRIEGYGPKEKRTPTALDKEVTRRVIAELTEAEAQAEKERAATETADRAAAVA